MNEKPRDVHLPIEIEDEQTALDSFRKVSIIRYREKGSGLTARREIVTGKRAVAIVAYDRRLEKLVMIRQFRLGAQLGTGRGMTAEIPAGLIDPGEEPRQTALRELQEETGLDATCIEPMCEFLTTPGMTDEVLHLFYAEVDAKGLIAEAGVEGETERTFPFLTSVEDALAAVDNNDVFNGIVMLGILWFVRHRAKLTGAG